MELVPPRLPAPAKTPRAWWVGPVVWGSISFSIIAMLGLFFLVYGRLSGGYRHYMVPTNGMTPTVMRGDMVLGISKNSGLENLHKGDVIIFHMIDIKGSPGTLGSVFIQRVAALPGEHVQLINDKVLVNGSEFMIKSEFGELHFSGDEGHFLKDFIVPTGHVFTLGDNTHNSFDGRFWGFLPADRVFQKAVMRIAPPSRVGPIR